MNGTLATRIRRHRESLKQHQPGLSRIRRYRPEPLRRAHNPKVAGSNPAPATNENPCTARVFGFFGIPEIGRCELPYRVHTEVRQSSYCFGTLSIASHRGLGRPSTTVRVLGMSIIAATFGVRCRPWPAHRRAVIGRSAKRALSLISKPSCVDWVGTGQGRRQAASARSPCWSG